jgi:hypothetical protein
MRYGLSRIGCVKLASVIAVLAITQGTATPAKAQWGYAPPLGYPVAVAPAPVYAYRPVTVFGGPAFGYVQPAAYTPPVIMPQLYASYSNPALYGPSPVLVQDRAHYGLFGGVVHNYNTWGPGYNHLHVHTRDGWLGHTDRVRYHY